MIPCLAGKTSLFLTDSINPGMICPIEPTSFLKQSTRFPVIDVRSPGEFEQGHVPGAINIPLFDDSERAVVGTLYVQTGRKDAILRGLDFALPKTSWYLESLNDRCSPGKILLHCWRGGLRSALMAEVFSNAGYEVDVLTGGYKAYRRFIRGELAGQAQVVVLGGYTGSGKTALLHAIASKGEQVVDLEGLACHKGSVFGALGQASQPTNEQFENNLYARWSELDRSRMVWLEDESRMIGRVTLPDPVVDHISSGNLIRVELDVAIRINRLVKEYSGFDKQLLTEAINRIGERLGGARTSEAITALKNHSFKDVAAIILSYYDKAYLFSMTRRKCNNIHEFMISGDDFEAEASRIIEFAYNHIHHGTDIP
jgi:tRNA 2-selenouridine synthase